MALRDWLLKFENHDKERNVYHILIYLLELLPSLRLSTQGRDHLKGGGWYAADGQSSHSADSEQHPHRLLTEKESSQPDAVLGESVDGDQGELELALAGGTGDHPNKSLEKQINFQ